MPIRTAATRPVVLWFAVFFSLAAVPSLAAEEVARVVGVQGSALIRTPGQAARVAQLGQVVFAGDSIATAGGAGVGLLAGRHYIGLAESTTARIQRSADGAPDVFVEKGRARILASGDGAPARLGSETLLAARAGTDTDVFAFAEKPGLVSMICPTEGPVQSARNGQTLTAGPGQCAVAKAGEPLYLADATHPPLPMLADPGEYELAGDPVARIGEPLPPVALGVEPSPLFQDVVDPIRSDPRNPCDMAGSCRAKPAAAPPTFAPPINGPRPGAGPPL